MIVKQVNSNDRQLDIRGCIRSRDRLYYGAACKPPHLLVRSCQRRVSRSQHVHLCAGYRVTNPPILASALLGGGAGSVFARAWRRYCSGSGSIRLYVMNPPTAGTTVQPNLRT
jgi:hypothetical protein